MSRYDIQKNAALQMRVEQINHQHAATLAAAIEAGKRLPPIHLADIDGVFYLIDGYHRLEAATRNGWPMVDAKVAQLTWEHARREAIVANANHGRNLTQADKQRAWAAFVQEGLHLQAGGRAKPSQQIAWEFGFIYAASTIRLKLRQMGLTAHPDDERDPHRWSRSEFQDEDDMNNLFADETSRSIQQAIYTYWKIKDPYQRREVMEMLKGVVAELTSGDTEAAQVSLLDI